MKQAAQQHNKLADAIVMNAIGPLDAVAELLIEVNRPSCSLTSNQPHGQPKQRN